MWEVDLGVPVHSMDEWNSINERAERVAGRISDSAGTGFGMRDQQWECETREEAEKLYNALADEFGVKWGAEPDEAYCTFYEQEVFNVE